MLKLFVALASSSYENSTDLSTVIPVGLGEITPKKGPDSVIFSKFGGPDALRISLNHTEYRAMKTVIHQLLVLWFNRHIRLRYKTLSEKYAGET